MPQERTPGMGEMDVLLERLIRFGLSVRRFRRGAQAVDGVVGKPLISAPRQVEQRGIECQSH
jgi:hypothetical protein